jgi:hypothetical protein
MNECFVNTFIYMYINTLYLRAITDTSAGKSHDFYYKYIPLHPTVKRLLNFSYKKKHFKEHL